MRSVVSPASADITFLVGPQRTGSTLLRVMLDAHPKIRFARHLAIQFALQYIGDDGIPATDLDPLYRRFEGTHAIQHSSLEIDRSLPLTDLIQNLLEQERRGSPKPVFGVTVHHNFPRLLTVFPDAKLIYLTRDPRDVARSAIALGWAANSWAALAPWKEAEGQAARLRAELPSDRWLELRYEDLVFETRSVLESACRFVGVPYDEKMMDYPLTTGHEAPNPQLAGQWRTRMSDDEIRLAEARVAPELAARGYAPSELPPLSVTPEMARRYETGGVWKLRAARLARVGLFGFAADWITRSLGLGRLNARVRLRIDTDRQKTLR